MVWDDDYAALERTFLVDEPEEPECEWVHYGRRFV